MAALRQYAVLGPLSSGSENRAFLGCEVLEGVPHPDLPVVVVWLPDEIAQDPKQVSRLQRETAFVTQIRHPNIIRVHGLECFEEGWARVVAFVDAEPLHRILTRAKEMGVEITPNVAARVVVDACEGVSHAHEEGQSRYAGRPIVHGGLRPDTLLVSFHGVTMVTGYGASVLAPALIGKSPERSAYFAPEQIIGGKATASPASDVYALGAMLYRLLSGRAPYAEAPDLDRAILTSEPPTIDDEGLRGRLGNVAATALAKKGSDRFESVALMKEAILTALGDESLATREELGRLVDTLIPASLPERSGRAAMLDSARDPDSVTILSRPARAPDGVDSALFEAARPGPPSGANRAMSLDDLTEERSRIARPREDKTVVDARPPGILETQGEEIEDESPSPPKRRDEVTVVEKGADRWSAAEEDDEAGSHGRGKQSESGEAPPPLDGDDVRTEAAFVPAAAAPAAPAAVPAPAKPQIHAEDLLQGVPKSSAVAESFGQMIDAIPDFDPAAMRAPTAPRPPEQIVPPPVAPPASVPMQASVAAPQPAPVAHRAPPAPGYPGASDGLQIAAPDVQPLPPFTPSGAHHPAQPHAFSQSVPSAPPRPQPPPAFAGQPQAQPLGYGAMPQPVPTPTATPMPISSMPQSSMPQSNMPQSSMSARAAGPQNPAQGSRPSGPARSAAAVAPVRMPAAVPRAPMREDSAITNFDRKAGDSSRGWLLITLGVAAVLMVGIFVFASPPPEVKEEAGAEVRHALPKELVKAALNKPTEPAAAADTKSAPEQSGAETKGAVGAPGASDATQVAAQPPVPPEERFGRLSLTTDPAVDVYDGNDLLGRSPLTAKLSTGNHKLRFTDKKTGLNVYRSFRVHAGEQKENVSFGTSQLVVEAPAGASILLNSRLVGKAPLGPVTVYEGKYHLKVTLDGASWADWFDAPPGRQINYKVTLTK